MKALVLLFILPSSTVASFGQGSFSTDDALKNLYRDYDPAKRTARWVCTKDQQVRGWTCPKEDGTVSVFVMLMAQVPEGDQTRIYLATSAKPSHDPAGEYNCHGCAPAIGAAVFVWQEQRWALESANPAVGFYGGWGDPPDVSLIAVGPRKHGLLLSLDDEGQGFSSSFKQLLLPIGKSVGEVWSIEDENDDLDAYDPNGKLSKLVPCRSSAVFRFLTEPSATGPASDYYDIEVISRGSSWQDYSHPIKRENWTAVYAFKDGKYKLLRRVVFAEVKNAEKPAHR
jgi:hypothetical protein